MKRLALPVLALALAAVASQAGAAGCGYPKPTSEKPTIPGSVTS